MKIVLDTNVLISGIFFPFGPPRQILLSWEQDKLNLAISNEIFDEYRRTAEDIRARYPDVDINRPLDLIFFNAEMCDPDPLPYPVCRDPGDDKFLACAVASRAKVIVSGDRHLLHVFGFHGIRILTPRQFIEKHIP